MATSVSGEFETALQRLEQIVAKLDGENVGLDESVALFKEGKSLAQKCERLLKEAQQSIDVAARGEEGTPAQAPPRLASASSLFDAELEDEAPF